MDAYYFFEEELISKMHSTFTQQFNLDVVFASELAVEILEILKTNDIYLKQIN